MEVMLVRKKDEAHARPFVKGEEECPQRAIKGWVVILCYDVECR